MNTNLFSGIAFTMLKGIVRLSFREEYFRLVSLGVIGSAAIFDENGGLFWNSNPDWVVDGFSILSDWASFPSSIMVAGVKYLVLVNGYPDFCLLRSMDGYGSIIIVRTPVNYFVITWSAPDSRYDPMDALVYVQNLGKLFQ